MPLRKKYPISDWILSRDNVDIGDTVAFFCEDVNKEIHAEVIGFPSQDLRQFLSVKRVGQKVSEVVNFYNTIVYRIKKAPLKEVAKLNCSCGAHFTSNPGYHLSYCDLTGSGVA